jgi:hypothetical protein
MLMRSSFVRSQIGVFVNSKRPQLLIYVGKGTRGITSFVCTAQPNLE